MDRKASKSTAFTSSRGIVEDSCCVESREKRFLNSLDLLNKYR
jgi:hypothetical protein